MKHQFELTEPSDLLDKKGLLLHPGWARQPLWHYDRGAIRANALQIKEWDYYYVLSDDLKKGITFTISDLGYAGLMAVCWLDFEKNTFKQADTIAPLTLGRITRGLGEGTLGSDAGILEFKNKDMNLRFETGSGKRILSFELAQMDIPGEGTGLSGTLTLTQPEGMESMNIATSWKENRKRFYYNRKINCMPASGTVKAGSNSFNFNPDRASGGLDWGRGAWTYQNRWYWSSASGYLEGKPFGFNLGYGFSDRTPASENLLFFEHRAHKLDEVLFDFDPEDYTKPWTFTSSDGRLDLNFKPLFDRSSQVNLLLIKSVQHQVFGRFSGRVRLDDGRELILNDFLGFAEDVYNRW
ncbi:DUF2804 domain-containing protein [Oceanispirochaeta sp.]|jgi:hypothetical protein|uniref:DUF2804 domain-containing protein n=1 Tax=Oceanispirochaeta sp. TaxID=2035350 RepID=UPI0026331C9A|nr:DUF2804 domain-containing protein [Oceanispirochaeta sp.]MDA3955237.1 DUF2804 domain-containing protein [Oceanispirochaeta sp.]